MRTVIFLLLLRVSIFAGAPIRGAFGIEFGQPLPDSLIIDEASYSMVPGYPLSLRDSLEKGAPWTNGSWAAIHVPTPPENFKDDKAVYYAQVDTANHNTILRIVAAVPGDPSNARNRAVDLGKVLSKKYLCLECSSENSTFRLRSGDGYLEVTGREIGLTLDYFGREYSSWFHREMTLVRNTKDMSSKKTLSEF